MKCYVTLTKLMYRRLAHCAILNHGIIWMQHQSFCSRKRDLDVKINFTRIGHTKLEPQVILREICFGRYLKENQNLNNVSSMFHLLKMNASMVILQGAKCDGRNIFLTLQCIWAA